MPRVSGIYAVPVGTQAVTNTTIGSTPYNAFLGDLEGDLNAPRPISAGGTGATSGPAALVNLGGEQALQVVTNYDSYAFVSGSFYSVAGATSAPSANAFRGIAYASDASNITVEARDVTTGINYLRQKTAGTWGSWLSQGTGSVADLDAAYVNVAGDTMTGALTIGSATPSLLSVSGTASNLAVGTYYSGPSVVLSSPQANNQTGCYDFRTLSGNSYAAITAQMVNSAGNSGTLSLMTANASGAAGERIFIGANGDTAVRSTTASTSPTTGALTVAGGAGIGGAVSAAQFNISANALANYSGGYHLLYAPGNSAALFLGDTGTTNNLNIYRADTHVFQDRSGAATKGSVQIINTTASTSPTTGALTVAGGVGIGGAVNVTGNIKVGTGTPAVSSQIVATAVGPASVSALNTSNAVEGMYIAASSNVVFGSFTNHDVVFRTNNTDRMTIVAGGAITIVDGNFIKTGNGVGDRAGQSGAYSANVHNLYYSAGMQCWTNSTNLGVITVSSDYRIKKDVIDLPGMWDTVKRLRPIKYTQAEFNPPSNKAYQAEQVLRAKQAADEAREKGGVPPPEPVIDLGPQFPADDIERWGFIAHELQETLIPTAAFGVKDSPDTIQSPNWQTLVAALTKALQEAMTRIEALEARA